MRDSFEQLRLRDLMLLEQVHRLGTLRLVSEALHVSQPAVTQMLQGLEQAFGVPLVERGRRGVRLTPAGEAARERLNCAHQEIGQARRVARDQQHPLLRLGVSPLSTLDLVPRAIGRMQSALPQARVTVSEAGVLALWRQLAEGTLDALVGRLPTPQAVPAGLRHQTIGSERLVVVARATHPLARAAKARKPLRWWQQAMAAAAWVLPPEESPAVISLKEWISQAGIVLPPPVVVSGAFQASLYIVAKAELVTIVPETAARSQQKPLGLAILRSPWPTPAVDLVFATRETYWELPTMVALRRCFGE